VSGNDSLKKERLGCGGRDLNPRTPSGRGLKPQVLDQCYITEHENREFINYSSVRDSFTKWMLNKTSEDYARKMIGYLDRFANQIIKDSEDLFDIIEKSSSKKNIILALRNLINFCEERKIISSEFANMLKKELKCVRSQMDSYIPSDDELIKAYQRFNDEDYKIVFKVLMFSGLRVTEVVKFLNEFDEKRLMLSDKIAKYPLFLDREQKKSYFVYLPADFTKELRKMNITEQGVKKYFQRRKLPAKYLRKWNYNFLILNGVPESVADFIQGRASITVGSMHYLAKVRQADEWYSRVVDKFPLR